MVCRWLLARDDFTDEKDPILCGAIGGRPHGAPAWFNNIVVPGTGGTIIAGPLGGLAAAGTTGLDAVNYQRTLKNRVKELVKKHSKKEYADDKVETFSQS